MAAIISDTVSGRTDSMISTHPLDISGLTYSNGDLILVYFGKYAGSGDVTTVDTGASSSGWTLDSGRRSSVAEAYWVYKVADTTETLTLLTTNGGTPIGRRNAWHAFAITGHNGYAGGASAGGVSTNPNPPSLTPSGGEQEYLWIAAVCNTNNVDPTVAPTDFAGLTTLTALSSSGAGAHYATRTFTASSLDPGVFTQAAVAWVSHMAAIAPGGASAVTGRNLLLGIG